MVLKLSHSVQLGQVKNSARRLYFLKKKALFGGMLIATGLEPLFMALLSLNLSVEPLIHFQNHMQRFPLFQVLSQSHKSMIAYIDFDTIIKVTNPDLKMQESGGRKILLRFMISFVEVEQIQTFLMLIQSTANLVTYIHAQTMVCSLKFLIQIQYFPAK